MILKPECFRVDYIPPVCIFDMAQIGSLVGKAAGRLLGKTYLVTGSTDGIGQHTALQLAKQGANVIVHGRCDFDCESVGESLPL